ncbi:glycosyltransferase family 2 protein [Cellulophaga sp. HaHaR_3_176]|uniref:glycosyltransferase n=1 Tax=Cellulophaga sp. HaHaR_3_176 TaxID=1942464 RepID=UPI001C1F9C49|nr:glycosyltransferase [Cellulophaga sp. HaHaR_3_176]QWX84356.1 glycosyltransferase family 2 protein [Cellulophaga sp. HaHaR_3_176]
MELKENAPIVLFTYNRIDEIKKTIHALKANYLALESELYIFSDGPKSDKDEAKVFEVRNFIATVDGFKKVKVIESQKNKGLANSIIEGVTSIINQHEKVIVLEDDLVTSKNFLNYMNQALEFYNNADDVISISGFTLKLKGLENHNKDYYYGVRASSWGWGCWRNKWNSVDWELKDYKNFISNKEEIKQFNEGGSDMAGMLNNQVNGVIDSWAIRFCFHQFKNNMKTVFPTVSKLISIGFSENATHTSGTKRFNTDLDNGEKQVFQFNKNVIVDDILKKQFKSKFSIKARALDKLKKIIGI